MRKALAEIEEEELAAKEAREAPLRRAQSEFERNTKELAQLQRKNLTTGKDPNVYISPETRGKAISASEAERIAIASSESFISAHPEYYVCPENGEIITDYFRRNECFILTAPMIEAAYVKLRDAGLIVERPAPSEPVVVEAEQPAPQRTKLIGIDQSNGEEREFSDWEVNNMSADEYRRTFKLRNIYGLRIDPRTRQEARYE